MERTSGRKLVFPCQPASYERFRHSELPHSDSIRLLQKHPREEDAGVFDCSLHTFRAKEAPPYVALSYTWGSPWSEQEMHDDTDFYTICDGRVIPISENLFFALRRFGMGNADYMWIDQICINQDSPTEKAIQVARMGTIYARASLVLVWLGEQDETAEIAFGLIRKFIPALNEALLNGLIETGHTSLSDENFWRNLKLTPWTDKEAHSIIHLFNRA